MITFGFKAGSGTASRVVEWQGERYTLGVFVQSNFGKRWNFRLRGHRAGLELTEPAIREGTPRAEKSSIIAIVATDAPLMPHQLKRLAKRVPLGIALTGGYGYTQLRRHLSRLLDRECGRGARRVGQAGAGGLRARRRHRPLLRRDGAGDRRGDPQRADGE